MVEAAIAVQGKSKRSFIDTDFTKKKATLLFLLHYLKPMLSLSKIDKVIVFPASDLVNGSDYMRDAVSVESTAELTECQVAVWMHGDKARYDSWCFELACIDSQLRAQPHVATLATWMPYQNRTTALCTQNTHRRTVCSILAHISESE